MSITRATKVNFDGRFWKITWQSDDFSQFDIPDALKKYGVFVDKDKVIHISDKAGYDYQRVAAIHEFFCQGKGSDSVIISCHQIEELILSFVPSKKKPRIIRQRLAMFKAAAEYNGPNVSIYDSLVKSKEMLEKQLETTV